MDFDLSGPPPAHGAIPSDPLCIDDARGSLLQWVNGESDSPVNKMDVALVLAHIAMLREGVNAQADNQAFAQSSPLFLALESFLSKARLTRLNVLLALANGQEITGIVMSKPGEKVVHLVGNDGVVKPLIFWR